MLTKEECLNALSFIEEETTEIDDYTSIPYSTFNMFEKEIAILEQLINEHFDNPPLKFEELKEGMWVWDNKYEQYIKIRRVRKGRCFVGYYPNFEINPFTDELCENPQGIFFFEENRFYRKQVEE